MIPEGIPPPLDHLVAVPARRRPPVAPARDIVGTDLRGAPVRVPLRGATSWTLVLFLGSSCDGCAPLWAAARDPLGPGLGADHTVVVTRGPEHEDPEAVRSLAGGSLPVVLSNAAWDGYGVHGPPFFAVVGPSGQVVLEGVAWSAQQVTAEVRRARDRAGRRGPSEARAGTWDE